MLTRVTCQRARRRRIGHCVLQGVMLDWWESERRERRPRPTKQQLRRSSRGAGENRGGFHESNEVEGKGFLATRIKYYSHALSDQLLQFSSLKVKIKRVWCFLLAVDQAILKLDHPKHDESSPKYLSSLHHMAHHSSILYTLQSPLPFLIFPI